MASYNPEDFDALMATLNQMAPQQPEIPEDLMASLEQFAPAQPQQQQAPMPSADSLRVELPRSTGGELLHLLSYLSRPLHAVAGAVESGISDDPNEYALKGAWKGLTGERTTRMADVLGLEEGQKDDSWGDWLAKEGLRFAADLPFDPLTYVGSPAKAAGLVGRGLRAAGIPEGRSLLSAGLRKYGGDEALNKLAGTKAWAMFANAVPDTEELRKVNEITMAAKRRGSTAGLEDAALEANRVLTEKFPGLDRERLFNAIEDPLSDPELAEAIQIYMPVAAEQGKRFDRFGGLHEYWTGRLPSRQEAPYVAHVAKAKGSNEIRGTWQPRSREIRDFVDVDTKQVLHTGKLSDDRTARLLEPIEPFDGNLYRFTDPETGIVSTVKELPAKLKTTKAVAPDVEFQTDPILAMFESGKRYGKRAQFLDYLKELEGNGYIREIAKGGEVPKGWEPVSLSGLELKGSYVASSPVARHIEQQFGKLYNPDAPLGTVSTALDQLFNRTKGGEKLKEITGWTKRNLLGSPGWVSGNIGSNLLLQIQGGMNPLMLITRAAEGEKIRRGIGEAVFEGIDNQQLFKELRDRGIGTTQFTESERSYLSGATPKTGERLRSLKAPELVAKGGQQVANKLGWWNDLWLKTGSKFEDNAKIAMAVDYLKKHADEFSDPAQRELVLDRAAQSAHDALIDYSAGTPWAQRIAKNIVPFYDWQRGITARTAKITLDDPAVLARIDRALSQITEPMTDQERQNADAWVRESAPIKGVFGTSFDEIADMLGLPKLPRGERMMLLGRYLPQGALEQMVARPMDAITSSINPVLKAPYEILANRNTFKDRPIDALSDSAGSMFYRPITRTGPYSAATHQTFGTTLPAGYEYLLSISPASRHAAELDMAGQALGLWSDKYKAEKPSLPEFSAWYLSGGKVYPYDAAKYGKNRQREKRETESRIKSAWKWALRNGDYPTAERLSKQLSGYRSQGNREYSSAEY